MHTEEELEALDKIKALRNEIADLNEEIGILDETIEWKEYLLHTVTKALRKREQELKLAKAEARRLYEEIQRLNEKLDKR